MFKWASFLNAISFAISFVIGFAIVDVMFDLVMQHDNIALWTSSITFEFYAFFVILSILFGLIYAKNHSENLTMKDFAVFIFSISLCFFLVIVLTNSWNISETKMLIDLIFGVIFTSSILFYLPFAISYKVFRKKAEKDINTTQS